MSDLEQSSHDQQQALEGVQSVAAEPTVDVRQQNTQRIEFELRRIANQLNDGQGIQSLNDLEEVARFSDTVDYRLIAEINPLFLDRNLSSEEIATFIDDNSISLVSSLRDLRRIGNQLQVSDQEEIRAIAQLQEASITINESEFSDLESKVTTLGQHAEGLDRNSESIGAIVSATPERYSGLEGMERYGEDQELISETENQYYYTHELLANTYQNAGPNCLTNQYEGICSQIADISESIQSIGLINIGNRNVIEVAEQRIALLTETRDRMLSTITRFKSHEGLTAKNSAETARNVVLQARSNINSILDQKINQEIDAGIITVQEAREMAQASLESSRDGIDTHFTEVRERILAEKETLNAEISEIHTEKERLRQQDGAVTEQSQEVTDTSEIAKRTVISNIVNACATFGMGENQLRDLVESTPDLNLSYEDKSSLYSLLRSRVNNPEAEANFGSRRETYIYEIRQSLLNLARVGNLTSASTQVVDATNYQNFDQITGLDQRELALQNRLTTLNVSLTNLEGSRDQATTELENQLTELNIQLNQVEVGMQESMKLMYEAQGLNDLSNEGFSKNAEILSTRTEQVFTGTETMQSSLLDYQVPELPWVGTRLFRTMNTPTRLLLQGANNLAGSAISGIEMMSVMAAYGYTQLRGINNEPFSVAMQSYENYEDVFSRSLTDHVSNAAENINQFNSYLFENYNYSTAVIRPFTAGFSAVIASLAGLTNVVIRPDTLLTGTYQILADFPDSISHFTKAVLHAEHIESGDVASWLGSVTGEILLIAFGPSIVGSSAKVFSSTASTASRISSTARIVSTKTAGMVEEVIFSANTNFNPANIAPRIVDRVLITNARVNESSADEDNTEGVTRLDSSSPDTEQLALNSQGNRDNNTRTI